MFLTRRKFLAAGTACLLANPRRDAYAADSVLVDDAISRASRATVPSMQFHGSSPMEFHDWQKAFHSQLDELLGDHAPPEKWRVVEESRKELEDHTRLEL